ncbi:MAG: SusD/RagB family nutrient-binding outer membrane lipoprotein [Bacteroidetes bacterium]|nr:SusD/RagB family nutrient-binding outer membrane lipoprotein [Bacteroidota bacterium]
METTLRKIALIGSLACLTACDKGFDEMNINPVALTGVDPVFQLNNAIVNSAFTYGNLSYETTIVKQMITPFSGVGSAANYNQDNRSVAAGNWQRYYRSITRDLVDVVEKTKNDANRSNLYHTARIWKAYCFMLLTDTYGDIPYKEAGRGALEGTSKPKYDGQGAIYTDILNELETATAALDATKTRVTQEVLFAGDVAIWKRLGNSLLLRAAMRLSKVNPAVAQTYVTKAVTGGLMTSNADNIVIRHNANFANDVGSQLNGGQSAFFYLAKDFVDHLKSTSDPRLTAISVRYKGALSGANQIESRASRLAADQIGMPLGYDNTTISTEVRASNLASLWDYSQLDRTRMASPQAPTFILTYAQTQLLLAEAITRGWAPGNAATAYANGVRAHMQQLALYGTSTAIPVAAIDAWVTANPLVAARAREQINTQYWVASFLNGPEAFANFRRSGFPVLAPNLFPGRDLKTEPFIRRLTYPDAELNVNTANVQEAIKRQGADIMDTRIWWDVK